MPVPSDEPAAAFVQKTCGTAVSYTGGLSGSGGTYAPEALDEDEEIMHQWILDNAAGLYGP